MGSTAEELEDSEKKEHIFCPVSLLSHLLQRKLGDSWEHMLGVNGDSK